MNTKFQLQETMRVFVPVADVRASWDLASHTYDDIGALPSEGWLYGVIRKIDYECPNTDYHVLVNFTLSRESIEDFDYQSVWLRPASVLPAMDSLDLKDHLDRIEALLKRDA